MVLLFCYLWQHFDGRYAALESERVCVIRRDAVLSRCGFNAQHVQRRTNAEKLQALRRDRFSVDTCVGWDSGRRCQSASGTLLVMELLHVLL
jgi:hypothetical protein